MSATPQFSFNFYRLVGTKGGGTAELVRDHSQADGMRTLVDRNTKVIKLATQRGTEWADVKDISHYSVDRIV